MKKLPWILAGAMTVAACSDTTAPPSALPAGPLFAASAGNTRCVGTLPPGTYRNVTVPEGERCVLENSVVLGNVTAREGSRLTLQNVQVEKNVHGLKAAAVHVMGGGSVGDDIRIHGSDSPGELFSVFINQTDVLRGNIIVENNNAGGIGVINNSVMVGSIFIQNNAAAGFNTIQDNRITQNLIVLDNSGPGSKSVNNNFLSGTVSCFRNEEPFVGGPNFAQSAEGQCF